MAPLDDVLAIPGNEYVLGRLQELLATEQAIAFVGAGASAGLYPLWGELIRRLAEEPVTRGLATAADRDYWLRTAERTPQQAVRGIRETLGRQMYGDVLRDTFGYRRGPDGRRCTPVHAALLQLPFRGYVTTNYDPGLLEARLLERPEVGATGYATWRDSDSVRRWMTGDMFDEQSCPILYAHGIFEKSDTMVLGSGEYRDAYRPGAFRELVNGLWARERLVFVGFGFADAWFEVVADEVLTRTAREAASQPRHVAVVGLPDGEAYTQQLRRHFADAYDAEVLLYPVLVYERDGVRHEDHSQLRTVLEELSRPFADRSTGRSPPPADQADSPQVPPPPQRWIHETTEDDRYVEPAEAVSRLDRLAADPRVRAIAINGIGGLGKTALVGHWLKDRHGVAGRPTRGLFGWSFNADRQVDHFLQVLLNFATKDLGLPPPKHGARLVDAAVAMVRTVPLVVVLDGLEVLQEPPGEQASEGPAWLAYGEFLDDDLRTFLDAACRLSHPGLVVLTSRFPFADLTGFLGSSLRLLPLEQLSTVQGAELLARLEVKGSNDDRQTISRRLDGHPLALRVFAATLARQAHGDPTRLLEAAFATERLHDDDPLEAKLHQLLDFYQTQLSDPWLALLEVLALFPDQVGFDTALGLARQLPGVAGRLQAVPDSQLRGALTTLAADGLLAHELDSTGRELYACHPVIRGHFRAALVSRDPKAATEAAGMLTSTSSGQVETMEELEVVTNAIALLLDAGEIVQADRLYIERCGNPTSVFLTLPAPREGLLCALGFVANQQRRNQVRDQLFSAGLTSYLNRAGLYARISAEFELADRCYRDAVLESRREGGHIALQYCLLNRTQLLIDLGRLTGAEALAREALDLARKEGHEELETRALGWLGAALDLQGQTPEAASAFEAANDLRRRIQPDKEWLFSTAGIRWADFLIRLGRTADARTITSANLTISERNRWQDEIAFCHRVLGWLDTLADDHDRAAAHLVKATTILRRAHMLPELSQALLVQATLEHRRRALDDAEGYIQEVIAICSSRRMTLYLADALVLRGRIHLDRGKIAQASHNDMERLGAEQALDDAEDAHTLAQRCAYAWAERDAALLCGDAWARLGDTTRARDAYRQVEQLNHRNAIRVVNR
jgi:tetratricopeptide (TPR) repeat protein